MHEDTTAPAPGPMAHVVQSRCALVPARATRSPKPGDVEMLRFLTHHAVPHDCFFVDPSTHPTATAVIVSPEWRGRGLGPARQLRRMNDAKRRGVRGFVAEIMSTNDAMICLARGGWSSVSTECMGSTVRVTALF